MLHRALLSARRALAPLFNTVPSYLGQVATKCWIPNIKNSTNKQFMSRSPHFATSTLSSLQIVLANWCATTGAESGSLGTATYHASVEYPAGVFTQILFGGSASSGAVADASTTVSDAVSVSIPEGALFWIRVHCVASANIVYHTAQGTTTMQDTVNGQGMTYGASITDQTLGGTVVNTGTPAYTPVAIIANTTKPSFYLMGDSITWGAGGSMASVADTGIVAQSIGGAGFAYINMGDYGATAQSATVGYATRIALMTYCSHVICEYGRNDLTGGVAAATIQGYLTTIHNAANTRGKPVYQTTITGKSTSTDAWATTGNQTTVADNAARLTVNNWIRGKPGVLAGYFDIAPLLENVADGGIWKAPGYTADGTHPSNTAYAVVKASALIDPKVM